MDLTLGRERHRGRPDVRVRSAFVVCSTVVLGLAAPCAGTGQLRPLEPLDWTAFDQPVGAAFLGMSALGSQPVALVGREGRLLELGMMGVSLRTGRVLVAVSGSAYRVFDAQERLGDPSSVVADPEAARRGDVGDFRVSTNVRLTSGEGGTDAAVRFGVRLPTTDDQVGLERDRTDFFATFGGRHRAGRVTLHGDLGFGVFGVVGRDDQTDPLLYAAGARMDVSRLETGVSITGHYDTRVLGPPQGNEHLAELRWMVRSRGRTWIQAELVRGVAEFSPDWGLTLRVGQFF